MPIGASRNTMFAILAHYKTEPVCGKQFENIAVADSTCSEGLTPSEGCDGFEYRQSGRLETGRSHARSHPLTSSPAHR